MAAGSTPTIYDPKAVISFGSLPSGNPPAFTEGLNQYTVPNEAGAQILNISVVNSLATSSKIRLWHQVSGASIHKVRELTILPDYQGYTLGDLINRVGNPGDLWAFGSDIHGGLLLDLTVAELKD